MSAGDISVLELVTTPEKLVYPRGNQIGLGSLDDTSVWIAVLKVWEINVCISQHSRLYVHDLKSRMNNMFILKWDLNTYVWKRTKIQEKILCPLCSCSAFMRLHIIVHMFDHWLTSYKSASGCLDHKIQKWVNVVIKYKHCMWNWNIHKIQAILGDQKVVEQHFRQQN